MNRKLSRRDLIRCSVQLQLGAGLFLGLSACDGGDAPELVCADPGAMTTAEESVRRTLNYTERSPDPNKVCAGCEFFSAGQAGGGCGSCEMFSGKAVNPGGHCDSWSVDSQGVA